MVYSTNPVEQVKILLRFRHNQPDSGSKPGMTISGFPRHRRASAFAGMTVRITGILTYVNYDSN